MTTDDIKATIRRLRDQASDQIDLDDLAMLEMELRQRVTRTANRLGLGGMLVLGVILGAVGGDLINRFNAWLG